MYNNTGPVTNNLLKQKTAGTIIRRQAALIHPRILPLHENIIKSPTKSQRWVNVHQWYEEVKEEESQGTPKIKKGISEYLLDIENPIDFLARDTRFELVTSASGGQRSIQLS